MKKIIISGMIGNGLEWYDYALYAQFAYIIGEKFFPQSEYVEILTFAVFAVGSVARPIGGVLFGQIGDRFGRRAALVIGITLMAVPTAAIGLLPSYETIGLAAPIILIIVRLLQGFSLGGEFSGCIAYIVEHSPAKTKGLAGSASFVSMCLGILLGMFVAQGFKYYLSTEDLVSWGWRIPFVTGLFIGLIGLYIRSHLSESPIYKAAKAQGLLSRTPLKETVTEYWRETLLAIILYINVCAPFYTITVYVKNYMINLGYPPHQEGFLCAAILITMTIAIPISAYISDKIGRKPVILFSSIALILSTYPVFLSLHSMNYTLAILSQMLFAAIVGSYMGPIPTLLVELFPTRVRFTGVAISYNLSVAIFGGTIPMVGAALYQFTGEQITFAYYLTALAAISCFSLCFYKETYKYNLAADITHDK